MDSQTQSIARVYKARRLREEFEYNIGNLPHWTAETVSQWLRCLQSTAAVEAEYRLRFEAYAKSRPEAIALLNRLQRKYGDRPGLPLDSVIYWIQEKKDDWWIDYQYKTYRLPDIYHSTAQEMLSQLREALGECSEITEQTVTDYMGRKLSFSEMFFKYSWRRENSENLECAAELHTQLKNKYGKQFLASNAAIVRLFSEGNDASEIEQIYRDLELSGEPLF